MPTTTTARAGRRYAVDAVTALRIVRDAPDLGSRVALVGPAVLRSHVLAALYTQVRTGQLDEAAAREQLDRLSALRIRLLGDRVSRATAWRLARELDSDDITGAEYLAVATLQADVLVAGDPALRAAARGRIELLDYDDMVR